MTFKKTATTAILTIVMAMSQMQCAKKDAPIRDEEPNNGAEPRVSLSMKYPPGKYEMIQSQDMKVKGTVTVGGKTQSQNSNQSMKQWIGIDVNPDAEGQSTMIMTFKRIRQETTGGPMSGVIDTSDPASLSGNPGAKALTAMAGAKITMKCDDSGKVTDVSGMNEVWDRVGREEPRFAPMAAQLKGTLGDKAMGDMINKSQEYMPKKPVGVGAVWYSTFSMPIPMAGDMECEAKCKLIALKPGPDGQIAIIEMRARLVSTGSESTQIGPGSLKIKSMNIVVSGQMELNVETGLMSKQTTAIEGDMSAVVEAQGQSVSTDATITGSQEATVTKIE